MMKKRNLRVYLDMFQLTLALILAVSVIQPFLYFILGQYSLVGMISNIIGILVMFSIITFLLTLIILMFDLLAKTNRFSMLRQVAEVCTATFICWFFLDWLYFLLIKEHPQNEYKLFMGLNLLGCSFVYIFQKSISLKEKAAEKVRQTEILQKDYAEYRLQALKNQVNPHFLFNSLSVLSTLVHKDADLAESFVLKLSSAYTYILNQKEIRLVRLSEELTFLNSYFFLLQIRFADKIILDVNVEQEEEYLVPPLILQLLLENAVKHNKMSAARPLKISISQDRDKLIIVNNINKRETLEVSTGMGLENIRNRYSMLNGAEIDVKADASFFSVTIPLIRVNKKNEVTYS